MHMDFLTPTRHTEKRGYGMNNFICGYTTGGDTYNGWGLAVKNVFFTAYLANFPQQNKN